MVESLVGVIWVGMVVCGSSIYILGLGVIFTSGVCFEVVDRIIVGFGSGLFYISFLFGKGCRVILYVIFGYK